MKVALSSSGRTRRLFVFMLIFIFLLPFMSPLVLSPLISDLDPQQEMMTSPFSPTPVVASEEESVDGFNVHPVNRWDIVQDTGVTDIISNGMFNMSDVGDDSTDQIDLERGLRNIDDKITIKFKVNTDQVSDSPYNSVFFMLRDISGTDYVRLHTTFPVDGGHGTTYVQWTGLPAFSSKCIGNVSDDEWYILEFEFDLLKSELDIKLEFDNGTDVFDKSWDEISSDRPKVFAYDAWYLKMEFACKTNTKYFELLIDYIDAPFKEREWIHFDDSADGNWLSSSAFGHYVEDDVDDYDGYRLCVPYLDSVSIEFDLAWDAYGNTANGDNAYFFYRIYTVDDDDGGLAEAFEIKIGLSAGAAGQSSGSIAYDVDGINYVYSAPPSTDVDFVLAKANFYMNDDRSEITMQFVGDVNSRDLSDDVTVTRTVILSDVSVDYSSEFVIEHYLYCNFDGDSLECKQAVGTCSILERDMFTGPKVFGWLLSLLVGNPVTVGIAELMVNLFRFLGGIFAIVGDLIIAAVAALEPLLGVIRDAVNSMGGLLETAIGFVQTAVAAVVGQFVDYIGTFIDDSIAWMLTILAEIIALITAIVFLLWNLGGNPGDGLPDVLRWVALLLDYMIGFVDWAFTTANDLLTLIWDLGWLILVVWWVWAVPIQWGRAGFEPLGGVANFIDAYFNDLIPFDIFGFHIYIPQGIVFTLWLILIMPSDFALWTAMG